MKRIKFGLIVFSVLLLGLVSSCVDEYNNATPDPTQAQDNFDIDAAKTLVENTTYKVQDTIVNTKATAKTYVESILKKLSLNDVTAIVVEGVFMAAFKGTPESQNGTNGSYTFTVNLNKGNGKQQTTSILTLIITATSYDSTQDNRDINTVKTLIENTTYKVQDTIVNTKATAKAYVEDIIRKLSLNDVTATVVEGIFTAATPGTLDVPIGKDDSYTFSVNLNKGGGKQQTTNQLTLTITSTSYDETTDKNEDIVAVNNKSKNQLKFY